MPKIAALRDESAEAPSEVQARNANLSFIMLDGNVGCVVNGAGLAMATMDLVKFYGIGGNAEDEQKGSRSQHPARYYTPNPRDRATRTPSSSSANSCG